jgi:hypothetical protein
LASTSQRRCVQSQPSQPSYVLADAFGSQIVQSLMQVALQLLDENMPMRVRLIGLRVTHLKDLRAPKPKGALDSVSPSAVAHHLQSEHRLTVTYPSLSLVRQPKVSSAPASLTARSSRCSTRMTTTATTASTSYHRRRRRSRVRNARLALSRSSGGRARRRATTTRWRSSVRSARYAPSFLVSDSLRKC